MCHQTLEKHNQYLILIQQQGHICKPYPTQEVERPFLTDPRLKGLRTLYDIAIASVSGENPEDEIKSGREVNEKDGDCSQKSWRMENYSSTTTQGTDRKSGGAITEDDVDQAKLTFIYPIFLWLFAMSKPSYLIWIKHQCSVRFPLYSFLWNITREKSKWSTVLRANTIYCGLIKRKRWHYELFCNQQNMMKILLLYILAQQCENPIFFLQIWTFLEPTLSQSYMECLRIKIMVRKEYHCCKFYT